MASESITDKRDFRDLQYEFARHIRDPEHNPAPAGIEDRRLGIYRELFYNNIEGFFSTCFPVLRKLYTDDIWHALMRDYFSRHEAHTPLFPQLATEFMQFLENERVDHPDDPPFIRELCHYEWVEWAVSIDTREIDDVACDPEGDLLEQVPVLSPLAWPLSYAWPVHRISPDFIPEAPGEESTYLVVYRDRADEIGFTELNPVTARLVETLQQDEPPTGGVILDQIAQGLQHPDPQVVIDGGLSALRDLRERDIVLGTREPLNTR